MRSWSQWASTIQIISWALWTSIDHLKICKCILKWLMITIYKGVPHCRVTVLAKVPHTCIICDTQFSIWIQDSEPARVWTWISGTKSSYANHQATLHWQVTWKVSCRWLNIFVCLLTSAPWCLCASAHCPISGIKTQIIISRKIAQWLSGWIQIQRSWV